VELRDPTASGARSHPRATAAEWRRGGQELTQRGYSSCNDECTVEYAYEGLPETGARLCAVMATDLVPLEVPFVLPPIDWLGRTR
jgi:hypothetical protein